MLSSPSSSASPILTDHLARARSTDPGTMLDSFLDWVLELGFTLYPAQEEALLEVFEGRHVILNTPTGSGKSLVAQGLHFKVLCEEGVSYYTSPIKALASEKFFSLCEVFGAHNVGMLTGDASINPEARILCCTAEVLANLALRHGDRLDVHSVVMDEFHYYSDRDRGVAWQIPLITLPRARFLLMSATLGDMSTIADHLKRQTRHEVAVVTSSERPVPLDYTYRDTPLHETVQALADEGVLPAYIVNFTQRECAELAQRLTSMQLTTSEEKLAIREASATARFPTPYGKEFNRFLSFGIGVHHAGLLPRYRLLVEQLAQKGLLKVIAGTDTLGVGVNIPIRTVLFTKLAKFDGVKTSLLKVRDFQQIAGRAGRKGFDDKGSVVCQAPEHVIDACVAERKATSTPKRRKAGKKKSPPPGTVSWTKQTFDRLITQPPERLQSRFRVSMGMILDLLQRDAERNDPAAGNFSSLRQLIEASHEDPEAKARHLGLAAKLVTSLYRSGIITMARDTAAGYLWVVVNQELQDDFSLFHTLSLFLVEVINRLDPEEPDYALDVVSVVETILEDPAIILRRQVDLAKTELIAKLKAQGATYEERVAALDEVTHPQPRAQFIEGAYTVYCERYPWLRHHELHPKSVGREMLEQCSSFTEYIQHYGLHRFEGVLLRYLSQLYKTLVQNLPEWAKTEQVLDAVGFFRALLERVDTSLLEEWEGLLHPELTLEAASAGHTSHQVMVQQELLADTRALHARVRAELHQLVKALSRHELEEAIQCVRRHPDEAELSWDVDRLEQELAPYYAKYSEIRFDHEARLSDKTTISADGHNRWRVEQTLVDPEQENLWCLYCVVDLTSPDGLDGPLISLRSIGQ